MYDGFDLFTMFRVSEHSAELAGPPASPGSELAAGVLRPLEGGGDGEQ